MVSPRDPFWGPILFTICINNSFFNDSDVKFHFYVDDTIMYNSTSLLASAIEILQSAFNFVQRNLCQLRLVLNADKTKIMCFSRFKISDDGDYRIVTSNEEVTERLSVYKNLGFFL